MSRRRGEEGAEEAGGVGDEEQGEEQQSLPAEKGVRVCMYVQMVLQSHYRPGQALGAPGVLQYSLV
jgi:hypothetical protein